jgi:hypothetical protein
MNKNMNFNININDIEIFNPIHQQMIDDIDNDDKIVFKLFEWSISTTSEICLIKSPSIYFKIKLNGIELPPYFDMILLIFMKDNVQLKFFHKDDYSDDYTELKRLCPNSEVHDDCYYHQLLQELRNTTIFVDKCIHFNSTWLVINDDGYIYKDYMDICNKLNPDTLDKYVLKFDYKGQCKVEEIIDAEDWTSFANLDKTSDDEDEDEITDEHDY